MVDLKEQKEIKNKPKMVVKEISHPFEPIDKMAQTLISGGITSKNIINKNII